MLCCRSGCVFGLASFHLIASRRLRQRTERRRAQRWRSSLVWFRHIAVDVRYCANSQRTENCQPSPVADVALQEEVDGDLCLHDLGDGLPVRNGVFDGAIRYSAVNAVVRLNRSLLPSISAIQWLCNADKAGKERVVRRVSQWLV